MSSAYDEKLDVIQQDVYSTFDSSIVPTLVEYLKVDNQSPSYDPEERTNGKTEAAFKILVDWVHAAGLEGADIRYMEEKGRTPFLIIDVKATEGFAGDTLLMYGHMDKQPPMDDGAPGWAEGLGPYTPVIRDGKLYGRGGADDGYACLSAVTAVRALQKQGLPHGHVVIIVEACEESGSYDLPFYIEKCKETIGNVDLVVCLDSGTLDYTTMYVTTSLRGVCGGKLSVSLLSEGMHSGLGGGIVPDSFRVARMVLSRLEDPATGKILLKDLHCDIPDQGFEYLDEKEEKLISTTAPMLPGVELGKKESELCLANTWEPCLTVTGADGMPSCAAAGNVLRKSTAFQLSVRLPPIVNPETATEAIQALLTKDPPYGARVTFEPEFSGAGWAAPAMKRWSTKLFEAGSRSGYGLPLARMAVGGSIPFMGMLGDMYPKAQFCITGILGPQSNAHGPNEFLHIDYTKKLTVSLTRILWGHAAEKRED